MNNVRDGTSIKIKIDPNSSTAAAFNLLNAPDMVLSGKTVDGVNYRFKYSLPGSFNKKGFFVPEKTLLDLKATVVESKSKVNSE